MVRIQRKDRTSINMFFDAEGNEELIASFDITLKTKICQFFADFDLSVVSMKAASLKTMTIILKIDNNIDGSAIYKSDEKIFWVMDDEYAAMGLDLLVDCQKKGVFFPSEFIRVKVPKNKKLDSVYCSLISNV